MNASENFLNLVKVTLNSLSQLLEVATLIESRRISEEILHYLKTVFILDPTSTVQCVQQMLKSLFSCNLTSNITEILMFTNKTNNNEVCCALAVSLYEGNINFRHLKMDFTAIYFKNLIQIYQSALRICTTLINWI